MPKLRCLFIFCCLLAASPVNAEVVDRVLAVVNDEVITLSEVNEQGRAAFQRITEQAPANEVDTVIGQARAKLIEEMIDKKIMEQKAKEMQITVSEEEINAAIDRILERSNATAADFQLELDKMGISEAQYRDGLRVRILQSKLVNTEVRSKIIISEEQIIDYYDSHFTEQVHGGGYYILQLGFTWPEGGGAEAAKADAMARAERVHSLAIKGQDFKDLAKKYSNLPSAADGGDLGVFAPDDMAGAMRDAITALRPGEISGIVEIGTSFQIFKLLSSQEGEIVTKVPYEQAKQEIQETLYEQEIKKKYDEWIHSMREQAYVKIL